MRTSPVHYIAPSAISITPNANNSANDLAVYIARNTKIKVRSEILTPLYPANGNFQEWTITGRNRRLADSSCPYTIYARLNKLDHDDGYLLFVKKDQHGNEWVDHWSSPINEGNGYSILYLDEEDEPVRRTDNDYWYVKLGEVREIESGARTVDLDTGILGTEQYNSEWTLYPDSLPLRVEIGNSKQAGVPYVKWGESIDLIARLMKGWDADAADRVHHWTITRDSGDADADAAWNAIDRSEDFGQSGEITLNHVFGDDETPDDMNAAVAPVFTITAWAEPEEMEEGRGLMEDDVPVPSGSENTAVPSGSENAAVPSGSPEGNEDEPTYIELAHADLTILAETVFAFDLELSSAIVSYNPTTQAYAPAGGVIIRVKCQAQDGTISYADQSLITAAQLHLYYLPVNEDSAAVPSGSPEGENDDDPIPELTFTNGVANLPTSAFADSKSKSLWLENDAQVELARQTVGYVRFGEKGDTPINCYRWYKKGLTPLLPTDVTSEEPAPAQGDATGAENVYPLNKWSKTMPARPATGDWHIWQCESIHHGNGTIDAWSGPVRVSGDDGDPGADSSDREYIYKGLATYPFSSSGEAEPASINTGTIPDPEHPGQRIASNDKTLDDWVPDGWSDTAIATDDTNNKYVYIAIREKAAGHNQQWGAFSTPVLWSNWGVQGVDGDGVQYLYKLFNKELSDTERMTNRPSGATFNQTTKEWECTGWTDDPQAPASNIKFCYCAIIKKINGSWNTDSQGYGVFEKLGLWSKFSDDGESALVIDITNDNDQFSVDADGKVLTQQTRSTVVSMIYGTHEQAFSSAPTASLKYDDGSSVPTSVAEAAVDVVPNTDNKRYQITVTIKATGSNTPVFGPTGKNGLYVDIEGTCAKGGPKIIRFTLEKVMSGQAGQNPVIYQLAPTEMSFSFSRDENNDLEPNSQSSQINLSKTIGNLTQIIATAQAGITYQWGWDDSSTAQESNKNIGTSITVTNTQAASHYQVWVQLSTGDRETLPIVKDGAKGDKGAGQPDYIQTQEAWSNVESVVNDTTEPTPNGGWSETTPTNTYGYAYLWRRSRKMVLQSDGTYDVATGTDGLWKYTRLSGTNGTSIKTKGTIVVAITASGTWPTTGFSANDLGIKQGDATIWKFNGTSWNETSVESADGDSYTVTKDCIIDLDGDGTSNNIKGHMVMWSAEANKWVDLGEFKGDPGTTYYTHVAWGKDVVLSSSTQPIPDGQTNRPNASSVPYFSVAPVEGYNWMGILINTSVDDPTASDKLKYTWQNTEGQQGPAGGSTAPIYLYKRSASAVTAVGIAQTLYYKFSTKKLYTNEACTTEASSNDLNGWSLAIPSVSTDPIYTTAAIAYSQTDVDDIGNNEWVTPAQYTENGEHGVNSATVFLYKRSATAISSHGITTTLYYKFSDGKLYKKNGSTYTEATDSDRNNWLLSIPATDGNPCYVIQTAALSSEDYDQIATTDWSGVRKIVEDGDDGVGIVSITPYYQISASGKAGTGRDYPSDITSWSATSPATTEAKPYLWKKEEIVYTDETKNTTQYSCTGVRGDRGIDAKDAEWVFVRTKEEIAPVVVADSSYTDSYGKSVESDDHLPRVRVALDKDIRGNTHYDANGYKTLTIDGVQYHVAECTDDPQGVDDTWKYEWEIKRTKGTEVGGHRTWDPYAGEMTLHNNLSEKGEPGEDALVISIDPASPIYLQQKSENMAGDASTDFGLPMTLSFYAKRGTTSLTNVKVINIPNASGVHASVATPNDNTCTLDYIVPTTVEEVTTWPKKAYFYAVVSFTDTDGETKTEQVKVWVYITYLGTFKTEVKGDVETSIATSMGFINSETGEIEWENVATYIRSSSLAISTLERNVAGINLMSTCGFTDATGEVVRDNSFDEERVRLAASTLWSPLIYLEKGTYTLSYYMYMAGTAPSPHNATVRTFIGKPGAPDSTVAHSDTSVAMTEIEGDTYLTYKRYKGTLVLAGNRYVYIQMPATSSNAIYRWQLEKVGDYDTPTKWVEGPKYYKSEIKQKADEIEALVNDTGVNIRTGNINLYADKVKFYKNKASAQAGDPAKIWIDIDDGSLHAVDGHFDGTVRAMNLFRCVALTSGEGDGSETATGGGTVGYTAVFEAAGVSKKWIGFFTTVTAAGTTFLAGTYVRKSDLTSEEWDALTDNNTVRNCWDFCSGPADEVMIVSDYTSSSGTPLVILPRCEDLVGKMITIRHERNGFTGSAKITQIDYRANGNSGDHHFQDAVALDANGEWYVDSSHEKYYLSLNKGATIVLYSVGTHWIVVDYK